MLPVSICVIWDKDRIMRNELDTTIDHDIVTEKDADEAIKELMGNTLVLWNDDHNTFDHVINLLVTVVGHQPAQAEQCALIVHMKGKCAVKEGTMEELKPMKDLLIDGGLSVTIQ